MDNSCVPLVYSVPVVHTLLQEVFNEGKASRLGLGGRHIGPDGRNLLVGWDSRDMMEVRSNDVQNPQS